MKSENRKLLTGSKAPNWRGGKPKCISCNKQLEARTAKYCKKCAAKILHSGSNNPNWKGGNTTQEKLERRKFQQTIQKEVLKRDNYTCQICKQRGGYLQVDHIQGWAEYVELRFSMDNCRTLCMDCHYLITYGRPKPKDIVWGHNLRYANNRYII